MDPVALCSVAGRRYNSSLESVVVSGHEVTSRGRRVLVKDLARNGEADRRAVAPWRSARNGAARAPSG